MRSKILSSPKEISPPPLDIYYQIPQTINVKISAFTPRSVSVVGPFRKIIVAILLSTFYFLLSTPALAQATNPFLNPNINPDVPKNQHTWTQTVMIDVMAAMSCQLTGIDPINPDSKCLGVDSETGSIGFVENGGGAIGVAGNMIAMLYTPPLDSGDYFQYLAGNFGIAKPAQAQAAAGFEGLKPIQSLWVAFRDIVYLLFVIIFVVIGLAIMLRIRIDPRTVMSIQNQIPKIIIGILLLTFSFAIAGFLIDMMYVVIFLSYSVITQAVPSIGDALNPINLQGATPFTAADEVRGGGVVGIASSAFLPIVNITKNLFTDAVGSYVSMLVPDAIENLASFFKSGISIILGTLLGPLGILGTIIGKFFGLFGLADDAVGYAVGGLVGVIAFLIISVALLFSLIKLWFLLIITYISILLDVIFAPFWIAAALIPGSPIGFGPWLRSIIANLAAFPAVIIMFLLAKAFIDGFGNKPQPTDFVPPLIGNFAGTDSIGAIIGLGIILMTPGVAGMVKQALKAPAPSGAPIITALGVATATPGGLLSSGSQIGSTLFGLSHISSLRKAFPALNRVRGTPPPGAGG